MWIKDSFTMEQIKTKKNLLARCPSWLKILGGTYLVSAILGYGFLVFNSGEWNPFEQDKVWNARREVKREQLELRKNKLGPLAGPIKIIVPYIFRDQYAYGHLVGIEPDHEATKRERARVEKLGEKIFGEEGYADMNKNKIIDLNELADVYIRMGLDSKVVQTGRFPDVRAEHLEQAVKSYEGEN